MGERWSFDRAVLIKVVDSYKPTGEDLPAGEVLRYFPAEQHDDVLDSLCLLGDTERPIASRSQTRLPSAHRAKPTGGLCLTFRTAATLLIVAPGPDSLLVMRNVFRGRRRAGLVTAVGPVTGLRPGR